MAGRPRKASRELVTETHANAAMQDLLATTVALEKEQGALDLARAQATARFETRINKLTAEAADLRQQLETWFLAHGNPDPGKKSVQLAYGTISQRTGNPTLKPLNRSWTWKAIVTKLQVLYAGRFFHPAPPPVPDKDLIRTELSAEQLRDVGLKVEQEERIHIELDRTSLGEVKTHA